MDTDVVAEDAEEVIHSDPSEDSLFFAGENTSAVSGRVEERIERRVAHQCVDVTHNKVHSVFEQQPHPWIRSQSSELN